LNPSYHRSTGMRLPRGFIPSLRRIGTRGV
jgi:hypothetical protein